MMNDVLMAQIHRRPDEVWNIVSAGNVVQKTFNTVNVKMKILYIGFRSRFCNFWGQIHTTLYVQG